MGAQAVVSPAPSGYAAWLRGRAGSAQRQNQTCQVVSLPVIFLWLFAWWGLWRLAVLSEPSAYVLSLAVATHLRIPPPFGQVPPLLDPLLTVLVTYALPCSVASIAMAVWLASQGNVLSWMWGRWLLAAVSLAVAHWRRVKASQRIQSLADSWSSSLPRQPWLTSVHPYFYWFFSELPGRSPSQKVRITRLSAAETGCASSVDVWLSSGGEGEAGEASDVVRRRPVFFLIHGGAWRGGEARLSPQAPMLQALAAAGFLVVSCEYRRRDRWPAQLDDCRAALLWTCGSQAAQLGADASDLTIAGASAGGHIATLLMTELLRETVPAQLSIRAAILFYPAVDPGDRANATIRFPVSLPCFGVRRGLSTLSWFFEQFVLQRDGSLWPSAEPLEALCHTDRRLVRSWPPTLLVHGTFDGVVPIAQSELLLRNLAEASEEAACSENTSAGEGSCDSCESSTSNASRFNMSTHEVTSKPRRRECDELLAIPGGRHTFEIAPDGLTDACYDAALAWLQMTRLKPRQTQQSLSR
ncbi:unnamed protein product [Polarella glacialis]|uniref:Alpha/beta hydrolase fold-3 domain-containing protein n=1 Tax=Polarella glacialis TaxID=89957 RepID=A0A813I1B3_POLGL|nr:unnamed protein product [Polarella glacialis]